VGLVRLSRSAADRDDRRTWLFGDRRPLHTGMGKDESAGGRDHPVVVEFEHGTPPQNEVKLIVRVRLRLVVLVDDPPSRAAVSARSASRSPPARGRAGRVWPSTLRAARIASSASLLPDGRSRADRLLIRPASGRQAGTGLSARTHH
jgi:hypothetical protein